MRKLAETVTVAGVLAASAAVAFAATAVADPPPPPPVAADPPPVPGDPAAPAPPPDPNVAPSDARGTIGAVLGQALTPGSHTTPDFLLSQNPVPSVPGSQPAAPDYSSALKTPAYLFGPNMDLDQQGQQSMYSDGPTDPNAPAPTGRIDAIKRAHGLWHMGIGQMPKDQLGQPLPGTAPPPGTNIPQGIAGDAPNQPSGLLPLPAAPTPAPAPPPGG